MSDESYAEDDFEDYSDEFDDPAEEDDEEGTAAAHAEGVRAQPRSNCTRPETL